MQDPIHTELMHAVWRKSSRSGDQGGQCVEVAHLQQAGVVAIRDSKQPDADPIMVSPAGWSRFLRTAPDSSNHY